jgi:hypothetical protein
MNAKALLLALFLLPACDGDIGAFSPSHIDRTLSASRYPPAIDPALVGTYAGVAKSGAGYFYDDVLEYRVWLHPEKGAAPLAGDKDYFAAFA